MLHFFFKDDNAEQRSATHALRAILHQLFSHAPGLVKYAMPEYQNRGSRLFREFHTLWRVFVNTISADQATGGGGGGGGNVVLILDALDECELESRPLLLGSLAQHYSAAEYEGRKPGLRCIVTSRPYASIERALSGGLTAAVIRLQPGDLEADVSLVITDGVRRISRQRGLSASARFELETGLHQQRAKNRSLLWVALVLDMVENAPPHQPPNSYDSALLEVLPGSLDAVYDRMLSQSASSEDTSRMLYILLAACRPLTLAEMAVALAMWPSQALPCASLGPLEPEDDSSNATIDRVRALCGGLVRVVGANSEMVLVHQTAREFLYNGVAPTWPGQLSQGGSAWKYSFHPIEANRVLVAICTAYLLLDHHPNHPGGGEIAGAAGGSAGGRHEHAFRRYAARHWVLHAQAANLSDRKDLLAAAAKLCDARDGRFTVWLLTAGCPLGRIKHAFGGVMEPQEQGRGGGGGGGRERESSLNVLVPAARLGLAALVWECVGGQRTEGRSAGLSAALHSAVQWAGGRCGLPMAPPGPAPGFHHCQVVHLLLEHGADVNGPDEHGQTPLEVAAALAGDGPLAGGLRLLLAGAGESVTEYPEMVAGLLQAGPEAPDPPTEDEAVVRLLLDYGADINPTDRGGGIMPPEWLEELVCARLALPGLPPGIGSRLRPPCAASLQRIEQQRPALQSGHYGGASVGWRQ